MKRTVLFILVAALAGSAILAAGCSNQQTGDDLGAKRAGSDKSTAGADGED